MIDKALMVIGSGIFAFGAYIWYENNYWHRLRVSIDDAKSLISRGATVIDVRTRMEWNLGHHPKAIHIPASNITEETLKNAGIDKRSNILIYCNTGTRARNAAITMENMGFRRVVYVAEPHTELM